MTRTRGDRTPAIAASSEQVATPASDRAKPLTRPLPALSEPPELVPARMINEVLYCERLLYLEWAQGEFADNAFTVEGRAVHRRTDDARGKLPPQPSPSAAAENSDAVPEPAEHDPDLAAEARAAAQRAAEARAAEARAADPAIAEDEKPAAEPRPYEARSLWLSSEQLGITGKVDVVEGTESGKVVPIEYKRGTAPNVPEGAYAPELVQIGAQALLLRDHGYQCDEGAIYFAGSRKRVSIPISEELVARTLKAAERAREVVTLGMPPPPLVDSPKCNGCSLVGICLPDETNLRGLTDLPLDADTELEPPPEDGAAQPTEIAGIDVGEALQIWDGFLARHGAAE
jgi:CRISP-associated protein Cas1